MRGHEMSSQSDTLTRSAICRHHCLCPAARCKLLPVRSATRREIEACHSADLVDLVESTSTETDGGTHYFTPDTYANQHTATCASLAAGACADVAVAVFRGQARSGAAIVRCVQRRA